MSLLPSSSWLQRHQKGLFLTASGLSTTGSFAGLTAKSWLLLHQSHNPVLLALHFGALALPTLLFSAHAGVITDRRGCEAVLIQAQWGLFGGALVGALAIPLLHPWPSLVAATLLLSTLLVGVASSYELTARNKYCALLVEQPEALAPYLASFSVVFNVGKLAGPPLGGLLVAWQGPAGALVIDCASYLLPVASVVWLLQPDRSRDQRSGTGERASMRSAWAQAGPSLRHVLRFSALASLVGFFHPGLAALIAQRILGPTAQDLGMFTSVLAAGSIAGGLVLRRYSQRLSRRPVLLLGSCLLITAWAQLGMAFNSQQGVNLAMTFLIGAGTAGLLAGSNLILQVGSPMALRGRMAGMGQIASLGGGGLSGLIAALLCLQLGLRGTFAVMGLAGLVLAMQELLMNRGLRIRSDSHP
mgnify:CR=1 FL=1